MSPKGLLQADMAEKSSEIKGKSKTYALLPKDLPHNIKNPNQKARVLFSKFSKKA